MTYLGIDLGTSAVKVVLIDQRQIPIATFSAPLEVLRPAPLWCEQNPADWWLATQNAMHRCRQQYPRELSELKAIGLSGQMHGATLLDKQLKPLRPAILWNDGRSMQQCEELTRRVPKVTEITGNKIMPGFTAPKVLWVKQHEPELFQQIHKILLPKDYLRMLMTGEFATDLSDASGTSWLDVGKRQWSQTMIEAGDIKLAQLPDLFEGSEITGKVKSDIANAWGIPKNTLIVGGGGDNAASAVSMGVIAAGSALLSLGTSGVYFVSDDQYRPHAQTGIHTFCHCLPNLWHAMNVHLSAASALTWLTELVDVPDIKKALELAKQHKAQYTPIFLPHLSGERSPYLNPYARGVFFGLSHQTGKSEMIQAVLEGIALLFAQGQAAFFAAGIHPTEVAVVGGGARSAYWGEILASALNRPLFYRRQSDVSAALGAAKLAWFGINGGEATQVLAPPPLDFVIEPNEKWAAQYQKKLILMQKLYQQCESLFQE